MAHMGEESESEDDFDGWLEDDDERAASPAELARTQLEYGSRKRHARFSFIERAQVAVVACACAFVRVFQWRAM